MLTFKKGMKNEITVRVYLESDEYGREFFDGYDSVKECAAAVARLTTSAIEETLRDGVVRQVGIALVPPSEYGEPGGYGEDIEDG
jgi:hypothetical protein